MVTMGPIIMNTHIRARDLGVPFLGNPGTWNAITDVAGIEVGYTTLIEGQRVRTGVTAIHPRGKTDKRPVFAGWFSLNGNGEMTGTAWIDESGFLEGPVAITNTHSVGVVRDAIIEWQIQRGAMHQSWSMPVVAETADGYLNDMNGFFIKPEHVWQALDSAASGPIAEGNVGGGTGMMCYEFKGGTGTASRKLADAQGGYTVGVLVQANFGLRWQLQLAGVALGRNLTDAAPFSGGQTPYSEQGSIIITVATDAPLLPHQLKRLARRAALGLARTGSMAGNGSGDLFLAFSTANPDAAQTTLRAAPVEILALNAIDPLFHATVLATEEAIINALVAAKTMTGREGHTAYALPHNRVREAFLDR